MGIVEVVVGITAPHHQTNGVIGAYIHIEIPVCRIQNRIFGGCGKIILDVHTLAQLHTTNKHPEACALAAAIGFETDGQFTIGTDCGRIVERHISIHRHQGVVQDCQQHGIIHIRTVIDENRITGVHIEHVQRDSHLHCAMVGLVGDQGYMVITIREIVPILTTAVIKVEITTGLRGYG